MIKYLFIDKISILNGRSFDNNPPGYELWVSIDKENWEKVSSLPALRRYELMETSLNSSFQWDTTLFNQLAGLYEKAGEKERAALLKRKMMNDFSPSEKRTVNFSGKIEFLGYDIRHRKEPEMTYYWKATGKIKKDWTAFVHFVGPEGKIAFQNDHLLASNGKRSTKWIKGEIYKELYRIGVPEDLRPGTYSIRIGLWDPKSEKRLKTDVEDFLRWEVGQPRYVIDRDSVAVAYIFKPVMTKSIRLIQEGYDPVFDWSIPEISLYGPAEG